MTQWLDWRALFARRKEKIEITVETRESWEVGWFRQSKSEICAVCRAETIFIPGDLAAQVAQTDESEIENFLKTKKVHYGETDGREPLICLSSLKKSLEKCSTQKFLKEE